MKRKVEIGRELWKRIEPKIKKPSRTQTLVELFQTLGPRILDQVCRDRRDLYLQEGKTVDAARKIIERAWFRAFPDSGGPNFPKGFLSKDITPTYRDTELPKQLEQGMLHGEFEGDRVMGSFATISDYLRGRALDWFR